MVYVCPTDNCTHASANQCTLIRTIIHTQRGAHVEGTQCATHATTNSAPSSSMSVAEP